MPTNIWLRLEPTSISKNLEGGLHAAIHDPLWMLGRQWQTGEFRLENVGSPVYAELSMSCSPLTRYSFGTANRMDALPLETLIEREEIRVSGEFQPRLAAEAGQQFLRMLEAQGAAEALRNAVIQKFPLSFPDKNLFDKLDHNTVNFLRVMANRVPNGDLIYQLAKDKQAWQAWRQTFNQPAERDVLEQTVSLWIEWYKSLFSEPVANESTWQPSRLEYSMTVAAPIQQGNEVVLSAPEYTGGDLDWYAFNIQQTGSLGAADDQSEEMAIACSAIPMPINYRGMPASRYWEFEDARVDFGAMAAGRQQLAKLLLIDFALIAGDDWFIIPVVVPVGVLCNTHTLNVWDTFNEKQSILSAYEVDRLEMLKNGQQAKDLPWSLFQLSFEQSSANQLSPRKFNLFLPPTLGTSLHGPALEEVLFLRDEMANMAWAVERLVEGPLGQAINQSEAYFRSPKSQTPPSGSVTAAGENVPSLVYRLESEVPDHWISLQPVRKGNSPAIWLEPHGDGKGRILRKDANNKPIPIHEEEVPREGAYVTRAFQYARWIDGKTYLWIGRRKGVGRGEGSSGLQFDVLVPPKA